jgi:hypothetical protein
VFQEGGRFVAEHQWLLRREDRMLILIDGIPVIEIDFDCLHIHLFYAMSGRQWPSSVDAYTYGFDDLVAAVRDAGFVSRFQSLFKTADEPYKIFRKLLKSLTNTIINAVDKNGKEGSGRTSAKRVGNQSVVGEKEDERREIKRQKVLLDRLRNGDDDAKRAVDAYSAKDFYDETKRDWILKELRVTTDTLIERIEVNHEPIKHLFYTGFGSKCQNIDSIIAQRIMEVFIDRNSPILPLHDSFVVWAHERDFLNETMRKIYTEVMRDITGNDYTISVSEKEMSENAREYLARRSAEGDENENISAKTGVARFAAKGGDRDASASGEESDGSASGEENDGSASGEENDGSASGEESDVCARTVVGLDRESIAPDNEAPDSIAPDMEISPDPTSTLNNSLKDGNTGSSHESTPDGGRAGRRHSVISS